MRLDNHVYRVVTEQGRRDYDSLMQSGLYQELMQQGLLVAHEEAGPIPGFTPPQGSYKILRPQQVPFISYPYEWSFSQLQDAALLTLRVQKKALDYGLIMKDASAYNVQFIQGQPILIDTLSFEPYDGHRVWVAYRQFCQHFLAPLALMAQVDVRLNMLLRDYIDGIPLELATHMLPRHKRLVGGLLMHVTMHSAATQRKAGGGAKTVSQVRQDSSLANQRAVLGVVDSLERTIKSLKLPRKVQTEWGEYYSDTNYSGRAFNHKKELLGSYISQLKPAQVWDLGGNDGTFSRVALEAGAGEAICFDIDPMAVEKSYRQVRREQTEHLLPLISDLTNPSPSLGWANQERDSLMERAGQSNTILALALIHHLAIGNNLPFELVARFLASLGEHLVIEFIPKSDSKVELLLSTRLDIFSAYDQMHFEQAFGNYFTIIKQDEVEDSQRTLYLMRRRTPQP